MTSTQAGLTYFGPSPKVQLSIIYVDLYSTVSEKVNRSVDGVCSISHVGYSPYSDKLCTKRPELSECRPRRLAPRHN